MFKHATNSKKQGDIGLATAINWFVANGYTVSIPLTDSQDYDLIVDNGNIPEKVQIKTTTQSNKSGSYEVGLRVLGGNQSWSGVVKHFDNTKVDIVFVLCDNGDKYVIPAKTITSKNSISVGSKWREFKVA